MALKCPFCISRFVTVRKYELHQYYHRRTSKNFHCLRDNCKMIFNSFRSFQSHTTQYHKHINNKTEQRSTYVDCSIDSCSYKTNVIKNIKLHCYEHIKEGSFLTCPFQQLCKSNDLFQSVNNLRVHFCRRHTDVNLNVLQQILVKILKVVRKI